MSELIRVLHVEDDPAFAELASEFLERINDRLTVETASNANDGLDRLDSNRYDCIVSDYDMPGPDGIEFLKAVREQHPDLPFVLYTGKGSEEVASDAISAGVTDYLQKGQGSGQYAVLANRIENAVDQFRTEQRANREQAHRSALFENTPDPILDTTFDDETAIIHAVNPAFEEVFGFHADDVRNRSIGEMLVPESEQDEFREFKRRVTAGETVDAEVSRRTADGVREFRIRVIPIEHTGDSNRAYAWYTDITERKKRIRNLELMNQIVQEMNDAAIIAQNERIEYSNPRVSEVIGYSAAELKGKSMMEFIAPEYRETVEERYRARLSSEGDDPLKQYEIEAITKSGETIPVEVNVSRFEYQDEPAVLSIIRDISERKVYEDELRQLKEEYETVFNTAQDAIFLFDVERSETEYEFRLLHLNPAHEALSGLSTEEDRGKTPVELLGEEQGTEVASNYRRCVEARAPISYEEELEFPAESTCWETHLAPVIEDDEVTQIVGIGRDISDRREREQELERYQTIIEALADPVYTLDADGYITYVNNAYLELTGYSRETIIGEHVSEIIAETDYETGQSIIEDLLHEDDRQTGSWETERLTTDGDLIPCEIHVALLTGEGSEFQGTVGIVRDISDRVERERQLRRERNRLDRFASMVSHDLRSPLNVAQGRLELAAETGDGEHLDAVADSLDRMEALTHELLMLARAGEDVGETEAVELAALAESVWQSIETASARLITDTERTIQADRIRLKQLLENLYRNAVEHGGNEANVTVGDLPNGFYVEDDGPGIPADEHDRIFESGYSTKDGGTGMGLDIVQEIVEAHDWEMALTEAVDGGVRFEITMG